jgi:hypothetical protein
MTITNALSNTGAEHHIEAPQRCVTGNTPPKCLYTEMLIVDWWWETQVRGDTEG